VKKACAKCGDGRDGKCIRRKKLLDHFQPCSTRKTGIFQSARQMVADSASPCGSVPTMETHSSWRKNSYISVRIRRRDGNLNGFLRRVLRSQMVCGEWNSRLSPGSPRMENRPWTEGPSFCVSCELERALTVAGPFLMFFRICGSPDFVSYDGSGKPALYVLSRVS